MRVATVILSGVALAMTAVAEPIKRQFVCIDANSANTVANNFKSLITDYSNATANAVLTSDFTDYSDSVSELINNGCPSGPATLGAATFTSRSAFEAGQGSQPNIPFDILNVWHGCSVVIMRWKSSSPGFVQPEQQVTGIIVMEVTYAGVFAQQPWLINTVYSEFNSGAWLWDLNLTQPTKSCSASSKSKRDSLLSLPRIA